jgi:capsular exopolysaccharide synthesis family protein
VERTGYLRLIWASKGWLALFAVAAAVVVYFLSSTASDEYESKALGQIVSSGQASGEVLSEEQLLSLTNLYEELAKTDTVLAIAREDPALQADGSEFDSSVSVAPEAKVGVLGFVADTGDPEKSAEFANAYADAFVSYLEQLQVKQRTSTLTPIFARIEEITAELGEAEGTESTGLKLELQALQDRVATETANPGDTMRVVERAGPNNTPVSPRPKRDGALAFIGALLLGIGLIYLRDILFDRYRSRDEVARDLGIPLFGEIPRGRDAPTLESFRSLRAAVSMALEQAGGGINGPSKSSGSRGRSVLVTGAESGCGKSYVSSNLARVLAAEGRQVVAIDGDLRRPTLHTTFGLPLSPGVSDLLLGRDAPDVESITRLVAPPPGDATTGELRIVPAGAHAEEAVERLSSERMAALVELLLDENEIVVFDSPPTLAVVDPVVLSRYADGVLFVVDSRKTKRRDARRSIEALRAMGVPLLGFVYNRSETRKSRYDAYRPQEPRRTAPRARESRT